MYANNHQKKPLPETVVQNNLAPRVLAPGYSIPRGIIGCWQLAGGHGSISDEDAFSFLERAFFTGFTTLDCADIYTGVEERLGRFRGFLKGRHGSLADTLQIHTKFVPDLDAIRSGAVDEPYIRRICERSLVRLGVDALDLVQLHWWDYSCPGMVDAAGTLKKLQEEGKIRFIGTTNMDVPNLQLLLDSGIPIISNQIQFSLLDSRPQNGMIQFAENRGVSILAYGTIAGGYLSERYLNLAEPLEHENRSLTKYSLMIEERGGWAVFQNLLRVLAEIASETGDDIASIASRAILFETAVAAVIIGTRSGAHLESNRRSVEGQLSEESRARLSAALSGMKALSGDIYELERDREGRHGKIMKYNLNEQR